MKLVIEHASIIFPTGLPGYESYKWEENQVGIGSCVVVKVPTVQLHLRLHDYFMGKSSAIASSYVYLLPKRNEPELRPYDRRRCCGLSREG